MAGRLQNKIERKNQRARWQFCGKIESRNIEWIYKWTWISWLRYIIANWSSTTTNRWIAKWSNCCLNKIWVYLFLIWQLIFMLTHTYWIKIKIPFLNWEVSSHYHQQSLHVLFEFIFKWNPYSALVITGRQKGTKHMTIKHLYCKDILLLYSKDLFNQFTVSKIILLQSISNDGIAFSIVLEITIPLIPFRRTRRHFIA